PLPPPRLTGGAALRIPLHGLAASAASLFLYKFLSAHVGDASLASCMHTVASRSRNLTLAPHGRANLLPRIPVIIEPEAIRQPCDLPPADEVQSFTINSVRIAQRARIANGPAPLGHRFVALRRMSDMQFWRLPLGLRQ